MGRFVRLGGIVAVLGLVLAMVPFGAGAHGEPLASGAESVVTAGSSYGSPVWFPLRGSHQVGCTYLNCDGGTYHPYWALDLKADKGDPVYAAGYGKVTGVQTGQGANCPYPAYKATSECPNGAKGNWVLVDHGGGVTSFYMHLSSVAVSVGDWVGPQTVLGGAGDSGLSTPGWFHLHYEKRLNGDSHNPGSLRGCVGGTLKLYPDVWGYTSWAQVPAYGKYPASDSVACGAPLGAPSVNPGDSSATVIAKRPSGVSVSDWQAQVLDVSSGSTLAAGSASPSLLVAGLHGGVLYKARVRYRSGGVWSAWSPYSSQFRVTEAAISSFGGDISGDGFDDLLGAHAAGATGTNLWVFDGDRSGVPAPVRQLHLDPWKWEASKWLMTDVNGDGFADAVAFHSITGGVNLWVAYGSSAGLTMPVREQRLDNWSWYSMRVAAGDLDGDGFGDLVVVHRRGDNNGSNIWVFSGSDAGPRDPVNVHALTWSWYATRWAVTDVNGDGFDDLINLHRLADGINVWEFRGGSEGLGAPSWRMKLQNWSWGSTKLATGDVDGDGFGDVIALHRKGVDGAPNVWRLAGSGAGLTAPVLDQTAPTVPDWASTKFTMSDVNADGYADLVAFEDNGSNIEVVIYRGASTGLGLPTYERTLVNWDWNRLKPRSAFDVPNPAVVERLAGVSRFGTAAAVSADAFPSGVSKVFVANGLNYPDALAGGVAAALSSGPVLLVGPDSVPAETAAELARLAPDEIVILGGTGAVSAGVETQLGSFAPVVRRLAGADRFATAVAIASDAFGSGAPVVVLSDGLNYPDALAGVPAAAKLGGPLLLTRSTSLPQVTADEIVALGASRVVILGGTGAVSTVVENAVGSLPGVTQVDRWSGASRFGTAAEISAAVWPSGADVVYVAFGLDFPDALAGGPAAFVDDGPLLLVRTDSIPTETEAEILRLAPQRIVILGGTGVVSDTVATQLGALIGP